MELRVNDFETVRWGGLDSIKRAALDRIEAEVQETQQWATAFEVMKDRAHKAEAEVERLQEDIANREAHHDQHHDGAEVMRLAKEVERLRNRANVLQGQLDDLAARAALAKGEA